jgi:hypothetical protein
MLGSPVPGMTGGNFFPIVVFYTMGAIMSSGTRRPAGLRMLSGVPSGPAGEQRVRHDDTHR